MRRLPAVLLVLAMATVARAQQGPSNGDGPPRFDSRAFVERYSADREDLRSFYDVPLSSVRDAKLAALSAEWHARNDALSPDDGAAGTAERIDLVLLADLLDHDDAERAWEHAQDARIAELVAFARPLVELEEARRALEPVDPRAAAKTLSAATEAITAVRARFDAKKTAEAERLLPLPPEAVRAARHVAAVKRMIDDWFHFRDGFEPEFGWWTRTPHRELVKALDAYAKFLREHAGLKGDPATHPLIGEPIGADALTEALRHERIPYTPAELIAIANEHLAWCDEEGRKAADEMDLGGDWMAAVEAVKHATVLPGEMDDLVAAQAEEAIDFVTSRHLVEIDPLCRQLWRLEMIGKEGQKTLPFAAYSGNRMLVAYPTEDMSQDAKEMSLRGNNRHFSRIVVPHELMPGHHLQLFHAERENRHRRVFRTPFLVEGWALYWEMRLWEQGWARSPEDRIGMLFWRKHRCARVIVSLGFHLGEMTTDEMIAFLVDRVGLEKDGATAEVRRYVGGGYGPLYQCAYLIGGVQLRALHREQVESGTMTEENFHATVLRQNSIPVELIRAAFTGHVPAVGDAPAWRFAD